MGVLGWRLLAVGGICWRWSGGEEAGDLGLEAGVVVLPAEEGVLGDVEAFGDGGRGHSGEEEAGGVELAGAECARAAGRRGWRIGWVRFAVLGV
jgi:hypothetical protein